jgi:hypothetical protein
MERTRAPLALQPLYLTLKYNNRKHPLSWGELEKIDTGLATEIKDFSYALGYNISSSES